MSYSLQTITENQTNYVLLFTLQWRGTPESGKKQYQQKVQKYIWSLGCPKKVKDDV